MHLVQIFLPLRDNHGRRIAGAHFERLSKDLIHRFGGMTAFAQSPATGLWKKTRRSAPERDQIVIYEVMVKRLQRRWWRQERIRLEKTFRQEQILIRAMAVDRL